MCTRNIPKRKTVDRILTLRVQVITAGIPLLRVISAQRLQHVQTHQRIEKCEPFGCDKRLSYVNCCHCVTKCNW